MMLQRTELAARAGTTAAAGAARRILILANPVAGTFRKLVLEAMARRLSLAGHDVDVHLTRCAGDIAAICASSRAHVDTLVIAGGDGSVNEALTGLASLAEAPALAILPFGTANVLALEIGLPRRARQLAAVIAAGATMPLHYGLANGAAFVLMVSAGFDAAVVHAVAQTGKRRLGKLAYALTAVRTALGPRPADILVTHGGRTWATRIAVVTNVSRYGGPFVLARGGDPALPDLALVTIADDRPRAILRLCAALAAGRVDRLEFVGIVPVEERVRLEAFRPVPVQIDGDPFGTTPLEIVPAPRPLRLVVPPARAAAAAASEGAQVAAG